MENSLATETTNNILIVDDNPDNLRLLLAILSEKGYKVRPTSNGEHALASIAKEPPDLILLDIMMPGLDGFGVCQQLKSQAATDKIPIIFISALSEISQKSEAFSAGGVDYITKPFNPIEVLARIKTHLTIGNLIRDLEKKNDALKSALDEIKTLRGIIPICAHCKKIRDDDGCWHQMEVYIQDHSYAEFSHGTCMECAKKLYPELFLEKD